VVASASWGAAFVGEGGTCWVVVGIGVVAVVVVGNFGVGIFRVFGIMGLILLPSTANLDVHQLFLPSSKALLFQANSS
jgi:hypothetical protein